MAYTTKDNTGVLFHSTKKGSDKAPDYTGNCVINGVALQIAGWKNTSANGAVYLSLKFQPEQAATENKAAAKRLEEIDSDIPF